MKAVIIPYFTAEDWEKDDETLCCTAVYSSDEEGYLVRVADWNQPNERPVLNEDPAYNGYKLFSTEEELHQYMVRHGFPCRP